MAHSSRKPVALILGPLPPPYMGPAVATEILLKSKLSEVFEIIHINTNVHKNLRTLGVFSLSLLWGNATAYFQMLRRVLLKRPSVVLIPISQTTTGFLKDSIYVLIGIVLRRAVLLQLRGGNFMQWFNSTPGVVQWYVRSVMKGTKGVIVLGNNLRRQFAPFFQDSAIFVVPNGADFAVVPSGDKGNSALKLLYLGNLQPSKGIEDVLAALALLKESAPHLQIETDVAGSWLDDETEKRCHDVIQKKQLNVVFHAAVNGKKKWELLRATDVFVFPPREPEGHPWVIIEAMAAGLPIISTDQGAIAESVIDGVNGFIVEKSNPAQIAEKIMLLMKDEGLRVKMGRESRLRYETHFTEAQMVAGMAAVFHAIIKRTCAA